MKAYGLFIAAFAIARYADGAPVRHLQGDRSDEYQSQTLGACSLHPSAMTFHCNPARYGENDFIGIRGHLALRAQQNAIETTNDLLFETLTKESITKLFDQQDFQTFSLNTRVEALYPTVGVSFVPINALAGIKIINPSLPELQATAIQQSVWRLHTAKRWDDLPSVGVDSISLGVSPYYFERRTVEVQTTVLDLVVKDVEEYVKERRSFGVSADLGLNVAFKSSYLPELALRMDAVTEGVDAEDSRMPVSLARYVQAMSSVELGKTHRTDWGDVYAAGRLPFIGRYGRPLWLDSSVSLSYRVPNLEVLAGYSPYVRSFGFIFSARVYNLGLQYTNEKQDNFLKFRRMEHVYLFATIST
jgi:hypothetical protein